MITLELFGVDEVTRELALRLSVPKAKSFFSSVTSRELHSIMVVSQNLVPYLTGFLHDSAYEQVGGSFDRVVAEGGYTADYAVPVHELVNVRHKTGTAKYLEIPWRRWEAGSLSVLAKHAEAHFIRGVQGAGGFYVRQGPLR